MSKLVAIEMCDQCRYCEIRHLWRGEDDDERCPQSRRECGHHCNHSWSHDVCCWCGKEFADSEDGKEQE